MGRLVVLDATDGQPEPAEELTHPLGVAPGQVIVDRDHVDAQPGQGVEENGQGGHERLAFARGHFRDASLVQAHAADELDIEVDHLPLSGLVARP